MFFKKIRASKEAEFLLRVDVIRSFHLALHAVHVSATNGVFALKDWLLRKRHNSHNTSYLYLIRITHNTMGKTRVFHAILHTNI